MADVIKSRESDSKIIAKNLKMLTARVNTVFEKKIRSPLTITLGDEFQGITGSLQTGIEIIWLIEELIIQKKINFKLRYVLLSGKIETPVNKKIAHGMLGEGLTKSRELLTGLKKSDSRFYFFIGEGSASLNNLFFLYQSFIDNWKTRYFGIISDFLKLKDYKTVAQKNNKSLSLMWKREKSLKLKEYQTVKTLISDHYGIMV